MGQGQKRQLIAICPHWACQLALAEGAGNSLARRLTLLDSPPPRNQESIRLCSAPALCSVRQGLCHLSGGRSVTSPVNNPSRFTRLLESRPRHGPLYAFLHRRRKMGFPHGLLRDHQVSEVREQSTQA